jgi:hypothetical protein
MRFQFSLNMPSKVGNLTHNVIADYPVDSLSELMGVMADTDFLLVREVYRDNKAGTHFVVGDLIINTTLIGKAKEYFDHWADQAA